MQAEVKETHKEIHEKQYGIFQIAINLAIACLISGVILAVTYFVTNPVAEQKKVEMNNKAMQTLVKNADSFKKVEGKEGWYTANKGSDMLAYIVPIETKGYGGVIKLLAAITPEGKEIDFTILSHNETPGLGDNAGKDSFRQQFNGKDSSKMIVVKDPSNKDNIQALTGATISSRAVTKGIKEAEEAVMKLKEGK